MLPDLDLSARLHGIECLKAGVTTIFDHHSSQAAVRGSLSTIARALRSLGVRSCLCFEVSDRDGHAAATAGIDENAAFLAAASTDNSGMVRGLFGLHASFTIGEETLRACAEVAGSAGIHVHLAEDRADVAVTRERFGVGPVARLHRLGLLGPDSLCVHGVHLADDEAELLAETGTWLVHCPESNMNNAVGAASLSRLRDAGVLLALGTDGFTAAIPREALVAQLLQAHAAGDPRGGYDVAPGLLFGSNPELARGFFAPDTGLLRPGAPADLVAWDYRPPTPLTTENLWGHLAFGLVSARAEEVLVAGRRVLSGGSPVGVDEEQLAARCRTAAAALWERF
jgi:cytosine/adenosine deaminase-related metal-dependent hydrolase